MYYNKSEIFLKIPAGTLPYLLKIINTRTDMRKYVAFGSINVLRLITSIQRLTVSQSHSEMIINN